VNVWIVHISHKHGHDYGVYDSLEAADAAAYRYVAEWWDETGPGNYEGVEIPDDPVLAVQQYFEDHYNEWLTIESCYVRTDADRLAEKALS
jgi:hypothetical protein